MRVVRATTGPFSGYFIRARIYSINYKKWSWRQFKRFNHTIWGYEIEYSCAGIKFLRAPFHYFRYKMAGECYMTSKEEAIARANAKLDQWSAPQEYA